jgi:type II secretory pathway component GspD/PulD (secretin)/tetratricopeptide (TPR) repeat protein
MGIALATAGANAQTPAPMGTGSMGEQPPQISGVNADTRPSRIHVALRSATDCYRRGDYELAATYLQQAQAGQKDLTPAEQQELATWQRMNGAALKARREGAEQLLQAEKAVREGQTQDALALLKAITPNQQFLSATDKLRVQELTQYLMQGNTPKVKSPAAQAQARSKLKQARVLLLKGNYDAAQALAQEAAALNVTYVGGEDTPEKVQKDIATARTVAATPNDAKSLLIAARAALGRGELDTAEALAREADKVGSVWNSISHVWSDSPAKVLKDVQTARAKGANKPGAVVGAQKDTGPTLGVPQPVVAKTEKAAATGDSAKPAANNTETARQMLKDARKALHAGNIEQAKKLTDQARALKPDLNWWEDTPDKLVADIRQAEGVKQTSGVKDADSENRSADPRALVKQARALYEAGKLDEAQPIAQRASTIPNVRWGLFEDSPDRLLLDLKKARFKRDQEESVRVMAEARRLYDQGNLTEAERLAHRAERLHGPYSLLELGDRPQKLLTQIEAAKNKEARNKLPPAPTELVKKDTDKPAMKPNDPPPPVWPTAPEQKVAASPRMPDRAVSQTPYAPVPGPGFVARPPQPTENGTRVPDSTARKISTPANSGPSLADANKARAQALLAEARQLQKAGRLLEARQKAIESQKIGAMFGPEDDRPESVLLALSALCQKRIDHLVQEASDYAAAGQADPSRYQQAEFDLNQARQLAVGFGFDTQLIDSKLTWVQQAQSKKTPSNTSAPVAIQQTRHQEPAAAAPDAQHGMTLLNQARMEIRAGQTGNARRLAEQAFSGPYGVQEEAAKVLRSIDAEEFQQKMLAAGHTFDAGLGALQRREYAQASTIFRSIDAHLLPPDKQARLREIMLAPELQRPAVSQVGHTTPATGAAGRAQATDSSATNMKPARTLEGDFAQQVKAMQEVEFQKLRSDGLQVQSEAMKRFQSGETDRALDMLRDYTTRVSDSGLDTEKQSLLRRPIEARLQQLTKLKHQRDFEKEQASLQTGKTDEIKRQFVNEEEKKKQIAQLMKQYNTFFKEGKYKEAEAAADKAHELDPDDPAANAAIYVARTQANQVRYKGLKDEKERHFIDQMDDAETEGPVVNTSHPLEYDQTVTQQSRVRKPLEFPNISALKSEKEREIYRRLDGPMSNLEFKDKPLREVLDDLHSCTGINIVPDEPALNEAGISLQQPLSMKLEGGISLKSVLNLLLHQVHLTYVVANEALNITTEEHARGKLVTKIHPVLDLVMPVRNAPGTESTSVLKAVGQPGELANLKVNSPTPYLGMNSMNGGATVSQSHGSAMSTVPGAVGTPTANESAQGSLESVLIKLITNTIAPTSWASVGGQGTIDFFPLGMALVINQTPDIQEQVAELLNALRRLQDQEVTVEIRFITIAESFFERIGLDFNINIRTNNSKYEPQIVSQQFRPFGFINSFTPKNFVAGLTPAGSLTQDLNIPIKSSSFEMAVPPFGQFPNTPGGNGGLELGLAFLSDIQVFLFMEAAQGDSRTNVMQAPKLTLFNGQTSTINVVDEQFFVTNVTVAQIGGQVVFVPNNSPFVTGGVSLTMSAVISADRRFVRLSLSPTLTNLASAQVNLFPITTFITPVFEGGATGQPIPFTQYLQQPNFNNISVNTTVNVPDGGTVLLGGLKRLSEGRNEFGPPILSKIPYINRLFKNVGYGRETESLLMMVTPRIIINEEEEERQVPRAPGASQ